MRSRRPQPSQPLLPHCPPNSGRSTGFSVGACCCRRSSITGARVPDHTFDPPVPITARVVWEDDGEEHIDTVALGWTGEHAYIRLPDRRYRLTSVWLDAADVRRR
jgi:hypothetical protein